MQFEWDAAKQAVNLAKHGVDFEDAIRIFDGPTLERFDERRDYGEVRIIAVGSVEGRQLTVVYTEREGSRRLISARSAHSSERKAYRETFGE